MALSLPAIVLMTPCVSTLRIRLLSRSLMYRLPRPSTATPYGSWRVAPVAGPPSPLKEPMSSPAGPPFPTMVVMIPAVSTRRIRLLTWSAKTSVPSVSNARPIGQ